MMTDPFASYGEASAPAIPDNRPNRRKKQPSALDLKMEEKGRLHRTYRMLKRQERIEILAEEPRLLNLLRYLRKVGPDDGDELLDAIKASDWLLAASKRVRGFALTLIGRRESKIRLSLGLLPLDDPIPPLTSVFFEAQRLLRAGGTL